MAYMASGLLIYGAGMVFMIFPLALAALASWSFWLNSLVAFWRSALD